MFIVQRAGRLALRQEGHVCSGMEQRYCSSANKMDMALLTEGGCRADHCYKHGPPDGGQQSKWPNSNHPRGCYALRQEGDKNENDQTPDALRQEGDKMKMAIRRAPSLRRPIQVSSCAFGGRNPKVVL